MPASKHRRRGKSRPRHKTEETGGYTLSPEFTGELMLVRDFLRARHGDRQPTNAEIEEALTALSDQLPVSHRLLHELDYNDPDDELARVLMAALQG